MAAGHAAKRDAADVALDDVTAHDFLVPLVRQWPDGRLDGGQPLVDEEAPERVLRRLDVRALGRLGDDRGEMRLGFLLGAEATLGPLSTLAGLEVLCVPIRGPRRAALAG
jgi:hypothetical protein